MDKETSVVEIKIGETRIEFEIPTQLYEAIAQYPKDRVFKLNRFTTRAKGFTELLRSFVAQQERPPSFKQIQYVNLICDALNVRAPVDVFDSVASCSDFIDQYDRPYKAHIERSRQDAEDLKRFRQFLYLMTKVARWEKAEADIQAGKTWEEVAASLSVKKTETVEKYFRQLEEWRQSAHEDGSYSAAQKVLELIRQGVNVYVYFGLEDAPDDGQVQTSDSGL